MAKPFEAKISNQERAMASVNLLRQIIIPPKSQVLIMSSQLPKNPNPQMAFQREMAAELVETVYKMDSKAMHFEFDPTWTEDKMEEKTTVALGQTEGLESNRNISHPTTVIYLGDGSNMSAIYKAVDKVGRAKSKKIRMANLSGFTNGDGWVMSESTIDKMEKAYKANMFFDQFLEEHPEGKFQIVSRGQDGQERVLNFSHDASKFPMIKDYSAKHPKDSLNEYRHIDFINIPGGERAIQPDFFRRVEGEFSAQGLVFTVEEGVATKIELSEGTAIDDLSPSQRQLVTTFNDPKKENSAGNYVPYLWGLSLGLYRLAGIKTDSDPTSVTFGKSGPKINFFPWDEAVNEEILVGFTLDNPVIMENNRLQFYPPPADI